MASAVIRFLSDSSILVALAAASLTYEGFILCENRPLVPVVAEVFFLTWTAYLFLRRKNKSGLNRTLTFIAIAGSAVCVFITDFFMWPILAISGALVLIYNLSDKSTPFLRKFIPRQATFLKPAVVGIAWAITTSVIPSKFFWNQYGTSPLMLFISNFFFITALAICDDIRDMKTDTDDIRTLPMIIGITKTKILVIAHLALATLFFFQINELQPTRVIGFFCIYMFALAIAVLWINPERDKHYQSLLIDGSIFLRGVILSAFVLTA